ncbi:hypothetical protein BHE74_00023846, partial [Ensete ventricosum]
MFLSDMSGRCPLYKKYVCCYLTLLYSPIPKELIAYVKNDTSVLPRIGALREMNLEYFAIDSQAFLTDQDMALEELFGEKAENSRYNDTLNTMAVRVATAFASSKASERLHEKMSNFTSKNKAAQLHQRKREKKRENFGRHRPLTVKRRLNFFFATFFAKGQRRLRPENLGTDTTPENKLRLLMIYGATYPEKFEGDKGMKLMQVDSMLTSCFSYCTVRISFSFFFQELIEKLSKGELSKDEYPYINDPSDTAPAASNNALARTSTGQPAHSMRSRRTATWAKSRNSDDGYS